MAKTYIGHWDNYTEMTDDFFGTNVQLADGIATAEEILLAAYGGGSYDGCAFVLYRRAGKLYEVNGGHCSCFGLEGQWEPEETTSEALAMRKFSDYDFEPDDLLHIAAALIDAKGGL